MKLLIKRIIVFLVFILIIILGYFIFTAKMYYLLFILGALLLCFPFLYRFENKERSVEEIVLISVITALAVVGRIIFAALPGTPVTVILILSGCFLGKEAGFIIGVLTTLLSNMFLGHGPWTAFQMATWGVIGFLSGYFRSFLVLQVERTNLIGINPKQNRKKSYYIIILYIWAGLTGVLFSLLMDVHSVFFVYKTFKWGYYLSMITFALPITVEYVITNIIFMFLLYSPFYYIFDRLKEKYGIGIK